MIIKTKKCKICPSTFQIGKGKGSNTNFCSLECRYFYRKMITDGNINGKQEKITIMRRIPKELVVSLDTKQGNLKLLNLKEKDIIMITIRTTKEDNTRLTKFEEKLYDEHLEWENSQKN